MAIEKHWASKADAKQDEVRDFFAQGLDWALARKREVGLGLLCGLAAGAAAGLFVYSRQARENEAWDKLSLAEAYSYYGRAKEADAALGEVSGQNASPTAAGLASLMEGEMKAAQGDHAKALEALNRAAETSPEPLKPFAIAEKVSALETAGKYPECAAAAQSFLDVNADHFLAPQVQETLSRCQKAAGQGEAAKATDQKIALQYPETPWAARANARLQAATK